MSNNNNKLFNDLRKTESLQQPLIDSNRITFNPLQKNINPNNYQGGKKITNNQPQKERYTMASPFPPDSLFDLKSTNSVMGFIPPEPKNKFIQNVQNVKAKKINSQRIISSNKRLNYNTIDANNINEKINKIKKGPMDDASNNSSNNKIIQTKSPLNLNKDIPNNLKKKFLEKDNYYNNNNASLNNNNKNNTFNYSFNNNTLKNKNILLNNSPYNNIKSKIFNTQSQNNFNNNKNIKNNINQNNNNNNNNNKEKEKEKEGKEGINNNNEPKNTTKNETDKNSKNTPNKNDDYNEYINNVLSSKKTKLITNYQYVSLENKIGENSCFVNVIIHFLYLFPCVNDYLIRRYQNKIKKIEIESKTKEEIKKEKTENDEQNKNNQKEKEQEQNQNQNQINDPKNSNNPKENKDQKENKENKKAESMTGSNEKTPKKRLKEK